MMNKLGVVAMTQDDIKELALRVATEMYIGEDVVVERYNLDQFATRFLAAYLAEQKPTATIGMDYTGAYILHGAPDNLQQGTKLFTAPPLPDTAPTEQGCAECGKKASEGWALYCVKCAEQIKDATLTENVERLAASQARERLLRTALEYVSPMYPDVDIVQDALAFPTDTSARDYEVELTASQTREARLREAITASLDTVGHAENARNILVNVLSIPTDDTALRERLKEEREKCAKIAETAAHKLGGSQFAADAIRSMA